MSQRPESCKAHQSQTMDPTCPARLVIWADVHPDVRLSSVDAKLLLDLGLLFRCMRGALRCVRGLADIMRRLAAVVQPHHGDYCGGDSDPCPGIYSGMLSLLAPKN